MKVLYVIPPFQSGDEEIYRKEFDRRANELACKAIQELGEYMRLKIPEECALTQYNGRAGREATMYFLLKRVNELVTANYVVFSHGWEDNREMRVLHYIATEYGIPILEF